MRADGDIGGAQRVGLDARLIEQRQTPRRAGGKNEFGTAKHADMSGGEAGMNARGTYRKVFHSTTHPSCWRETRPSGMGVQPLAAPTLENRFRMRSNRPSQTSR